MRKSKLNSQKHKTLTGHATVRFPNLQHSMLKAECAQRRITMEQGLLEAFETWVAGGAPAVKLKGAQSAEMRRLYGLVQVIASRPDKRRLEAVTCVLEALAR